MFITIPVTPFALYQKSSDVIELDMNIIICSTGEEYIVEFKSRKFPKVWVAVSFTLVDLSFLFNRVLP